MSLIKAHIHQHEPKLHVGSYIHCEDFGMVNKFDKAFEKGECPLY